MILLNTLANHKFFVLLQVDCYRCALTKRLN